MWWRRFIKRKEDAEQDWTFVEFVEMMRFSTDYIPFICEDKELEKEFKEVSARSETFDNVRMQLRTHISPIIPAVKAWQQAKKKVSLRHWLENEYILVLSRTAEHRTAIDPIYRVLFGVAAAMALSYPDTTTRRTWFFLDELGNAGELTKLMELMSAGRTKGCSVVLGVQGFPTLQRAFQDQNAVNEILELCPYVISLRLGGEVSAKFVSGLLGEIEFYEESTSETVTDAYTSSHSVANTVGSSHAVGTGKSHTEGHSTTDGETKGTSENISVQGDYASNPHLPYYLPNGWLNNPQSISRSRGTSESRSHSDTASKSDTISANVTDTVNTGRTDTKTFGETHSQAKTVNTNRLQKHLVLPSQLMDLPTLKYDGMLVGICIAPFGTYSMAQPGEYITQTLMKPKLDRRLYRPRIIKGSSHKSAAKALPANHAEKDDAMSDTMNNDQAGDVLDKMRNESLRTPRHLEL